jgi:hypothetical protein
MADLHVLPCLYLPHLYRPCVSLPYLRLSGSCLCLPGLRLFCPCRLIHPGPTTLHRTKPSASRLSRLIRAGPARS